MRLPYSSAYRFVALRLSAFVCFLCYAGVLVAAPSTVILRIAFSVDVGIDFPSVLVPHVLGRANLEGVQYEYNPQDNIGVYSGIGPDTAVASVETMFMSTEGAVRAVQSGDADAAIVAGDGCQVTDSSNAGRTLAAGMDQARLGSTGLAIAANHHSPLVKLSFEQLADLLNGKITNFTQLGGQPWPIHFLPNPLKDPVIFGYLGRGASPMLGVSGAGLARISYNQLSMARASFLREMHDDPYGVMVLMPPIPSNLKALAIGPAGGMAHRMEVTDLNDGDYPFTTPVYGCFSKLPKHGRRGLEALRNEVGSYNFAATMLVNGMTREELSLVSIGHLDGAPPEWDRATSTALRLSESIHFAPNSTEISKESSANIDAIAKFLKTLAFGPSQVRYVGFVDSQGNASAEEALSKKLASVVASELKKRGLSSGQIISAGAGFPLADSLMPNHETRNQRVEIWIVP